MPRKNRISASALQNRDNQRRSRTRHRQFVEDLQQRVLRYEQQGVQASIELQHVARTVAWENQHLRGLLHRRGVSQQEIDRHLSLAGHFDTGSNLDLCTPLQTDAGGPPLAAKQPPPGTLHTTASQDEEYVPSTASTPASSPAFSPQTQSRIHAPVPATPFRPTTLVDLVEKHDTLDSHATSFSPGRASIPFICNDDMTHPGRRAEILPPVSDCFCPPEMPMSTPGQKSTATPCTVAIDMVAGMQSNVQVDQVREWLHCGESDDCEVQNTSLFQLMDRIT
jgi:hypothetical protein